MSLVEALVVMLIGYLITFVACSIRVKGDRKVKWTQESICQFVLFGSVIGWLVGLIYIVSVVVAMVGMISYWVFHGIKGVIGRRTNGPSFWS